MAGPENPSIDPKAVDAAYRPFPSFGDWVGTPVNEPRWARYTSELDKLKASTPDQFRRALDVVKRASALDTGAIEGLYETDLGLTFTVAVAASMWESTLDKRSEKARPLFEAQLKAYDAVLDLATHSVPLAEAWIRELHRQICGAQDTYTAWTEIGWQELSLPKGEYKSLPNHVALADGSVHAYAPVDLTPEEMHRLCTELRSEAFLSAHPVLQASYAHYGLTVIHPFADGNGRVARALASVFTYRCCSVPVMILSENRVEYLAALRQADDGDFSRFVDFILERTLDAIQLARASIETASRPLTEESVDAIKRLYITSGGYTQEQVDSAGSNLLELASSEMERQIADLKSSEGLTSRVARSTTDYSILRPNYRFPFSRASTIELHLSTKPPAEESVSLLIGIDVPKDCGKEDDLILHNIHNPQLTFEARVTELLPSPNAALQIRLRVWVEGLLRTQLAELAQKAQLKTKS